MDRLLQEYKPDLVLLEPSGIADLNSVNSIIGIYEKKALIKTHKIVIVDPVRLPMLMEVLTPLITFQIKSAELVRINKEDLASPEEMENALKKVRDIHPETKILFSTLKDHLDPSIVDKFVS